MPTNIAGAVTLMRYHQGMPLDGHSRVVEDHRGDGNAAAHGGFKIESGHAEGRIAHEVDAEFFWRCKLGADNEAQTRAEGVRFAPSDVAARHSRPVEGHELVPWAARVVCDDGVTRVHRLHKFPDDAVGRNGHLA